MTTLTGRPLDDTYRDLLQVPNANDGIDTTLRAVEDGAGKPTVLLLADLAGGVKGWIYGELDAAAADNAARLAAWDTLAGAGGGTDTVAIVRPGTYTTAPVILSHIRRLVIGPGVTLRLKAASSGPMIDIRRHDFTLDLYGTIDGNRANQSANDIRLVHSYGYDRVRVSGHGLRGLVTGSRGQGVWLRDGDDLLIEGMRGTDCGLEPLVIENVTRPTMRRPRIADCLVDRTAEDFTAVPTISHTGCIKITASQPDVVIEDGEIARCTARHAATNQNVAIEMWANSDQSMRWCRIAHCTSDGPALGIGQSIAKGAGCAIVSPVARNAVLQLELADCDHSAIEGGLADCNGVTGSTGATIDNAHADGYGNKCRGLRALNFKSYGVKVVSGAGYATRSHDSEITGNYLRTTHGGAVGIANDGGPDSVISANQVRLGGAACVGIIAGNATGLMCEGNAIAYHDTSTGLLVVEADGVVARGNRFRSTSASATGMVPIALNNVTYFEVTGGTMKGLQEQGVNLVSQGSGKHVDHGVVGGWSSESANAGINPVNQSGGTLGDHVRTRPIQGWLPWGIVEEAWFEKYATDLDDAVWGGGYMPSGDPETWSGGILGADGSKITANGTLYVKKAGTWTDAA